MANIGKWNAPRGFNTLISTGLNALANNPSTMASSLTYDNTTNLDIYADVEIVLQSLSPTAGAYCAIYLAESLDGTSFPAQSAADMRLTSTQLWCTIPVGTTATTLQRVVVRQLILPPSKMVFYFDNQTGVALASLNTNTFSINPYNINGNG